MARNRFLPFKSQSSLCQFVGQQFFIDRVNSPGASPEALQKQRPLVRGEHASRVLRSASRRERFGWLGRDAQADTRDACAPRTNTNQAEASFGECTHERLKQSGACL